MLQPLKGPAGDDFHHDIARDIGQQVEAMILEAQPEIVPFAGCLGRIRHPEQRVVSNMFCYVVFRTGFCPCPAPKLKSDMIPWGVRPSAFVFT